MSLLDCDDQPTMQVMAQRNPLQADEMGLALHNLVVVRTLSGARLSRPSARQQAMWGTLGIKVDYTLYSYDGDVDNGQFIYSPADRRLFRLTGAHGKSYARGTLRTFWSYSVEEITSQVIWDTGAQV